MRTASKPISSLPNDISAFKFKYRLEKLQGSLQMFFLLFSFFGKCSVNMGLPRCFSFCSVVGLLFSCSIGSRIVLGISFCFVQMFSVTGRFYRFLHRA